ncbi:hypothetical protein MSG28_001320 [Choristoneura fumiferana]|uniref:Uncharacterized protein n=1 Tax=Choristoneura fumiferana TaxID=7141 RepID=A0ACC0KUK4_CHOFU|nr:hypothetical protein MSG28_001320 [Choristoneura fumiferana]
MAFKLILIAVAMLHVVACMPAITLEDLEIADDTAAVGSYVREVRAAAPQDYHKSYENDGDGEIGYSRKKQGGGKKGYQHFDSYHKKAGDNYEFEKQDSFGHDDGGNQGAYSHQHERKEKAQKYREPEQEEEEEQHHGVPLKDVTHEELKEGANDGNGGVEAHGHDPKDYIIPEKYVYGEGEEYNF